MIQFNSFRYQACRYFTCYYIVEGKFEWQIEDKVYTLYPGDVAIILPGQRVGGLKELLQIGTLGWLRLHLQHDGNNINLANEQWSSLSINEAKAISRIINQNPLPVLTNSKQIPGIFNQLEQEIFNQEIGFVTRTNQLIDELFITTARQLTRKNNIQHDFPKSFLLLEQTLRKNLAHQWTVEEMGSLLGMGNTSFSEKVKSYTGFSPLHYLINIRISEAVKLLKRPDVHITDIALQVGFYSSQHFATTFKKLTGYSPRDFRKNNFTNQ